MQADNFYYVCLFIIQLSREMENFVTTLQFVYIPKTDINRKSAMILCVQRFVFLMHAQMRNLAHANLVCRNGKKRRKKNNNKGTIRK